jgi:hypothetical protein
MVVPYGGELYLLMRFTGENNISTEAQQSYLGLTITTGADNFHRTPKKPRMHPKPRAY